MLFDIWRYLLNPVSSHVAIQHLKCIFCSYKMTQRILIKVKSLFVLPVLSLWQNCCFLIGLIKKKKKKKKSREALCVDWVRPTNRTFDHLQLSLQWNPQSSNTQSFFSWSHFQVKQTLLVPRQHDRFTRLY